MIDAPSYYFRRFLICNFKIEYNYLYKGELYNELISKFLNVRTPLIFHKIKRTHSLNLNHCKE